MIVVRLLVLLLLCLTGFGAHAQPAGCTTTTCTGFALPSGYLSVSGNQFVNGLGQAQRLACAEFKGAPNDGSMTAIRAAGFNCIRLDWRDALLGNTTFDDEFTTAPWLTHEAWVSGDKWSFVGTAFPTGISQGPTWWSNPIDTPSAAPVYSNTGGHLNLGLIQNPGGNGISNTTLGALINNQLTPGGLVQLFGYHEFSVAVPATPGFLFQWDIECQPATCSDGGMEFDVGIWTNGDGSQHVRFWNQANGSGNPVYFETTSTNITAQNVYGIDWQSANTTFYINGTQVAQIATPGGEFKTAGALSYFATSDATYFAYGPAFTAASATATLDYYRVSPQKTSGGSGTSCNTSADIATCVANANTAGLKVVLSHRGNEIPTGTCVTRQANGLWFDSGGSSGGSDGCGAANSGNYTYAQFKADTVALLQQFSGNSTVIGYEMHHQPLVQGAFTGTGGAPTGAFSVSGGQLIGPNGSPFVLRGFAIMPDAAVPSPATLATQFPGTNFINWASGQKSGAGYTSFLPASNWFSNVDAFLAAGFVTMISDYTPGAPSCRTGSDLQGAYDWYAAWATHYATNPNVMFTSQNECFMNGNDFNYFRGLYAAIRNAEKAVTGSVAHMIWMEPGDEQQNCSNAGGISGNIFNGTFTLGGTTFSGMTHVGYNMHTYPWNYPGGSQNNCGGSGNALSDYTSALVKEVLTYHNAASSADGVMPVIMGEGGNSTGGNSNPPDDRFINGLYATVNAWLTETGQGSSGITGYAAWLYNYDNFFFAPNPDTDTLYLNGAVTSPFGTQVKANIALCSGASNCSTSGGGGGGGGGAGTNPAVSWGGGGDTDVLAACSDVGAAVAAVNSGVIEFCPGPINNAGSLLLSGAAKP